MADLLRLIYSSRPFGFDDAALNGILSAARRNNPKAELTGALVCRFDLYLQLLEGPEAAVDAMYSRIVRDNRHVDVKLHLRGRVGARLFPAWAMRDDPARSWMWTPDEISGGALDRATPRDILAVFDRLAADPA